MIYFIASIISIHILIFAFQGTILYYVSKPYRVSWLDGKLIFDKTKDRYVLVVHLALFATTIVSAKFINLYTEYGFMDYMVSGILTLFNILTLLIMKKVYKNQDDFFFAFRTKDEVNSVIDEGNDICVVPREHFKENQSNNELLLCKEFETAQNNFQRIPDSLENEKNSVDCNSNVTSDIGIDSSEISSLLIDIDMFKSLLSKFIDLNILNTNYNFNGLGTHYSKPITQLAVLIYELNESKIIKLKNQSKEIPILSKFFKVELTSAYYSQIKGSFDPTKGTREYEFIRDKIQTFI